MVSSLSCGKVVAAIADGCGSGKRAFIESRMVIELMENCIDAGFEEKTAIDLSIRHTLIAVAKTAL